MTQRLVSVLALAGVVLLAGCGLSLGGGSNPVSRALRDYQACGQQAAERYIPQSALNAHAIANQAVADCDDAWQVYQQRLQTRYMRTVHSLSESHQFAMRDAMETRIHENSRLVDMVRQQRVR